MLDDIRNHDAKPTEEERAWMEVDVWGTALRAGVVGALALAIGLGTTALVDDRELAAQVVIFAPR